jgi:lipid-binding SYLF domain-containing protein
MKKVILACMSLAIATSAFGSLSKDEVKRLEESAAIVRELRTAPDKAIPEQLWDKAECALVIPSIKKAAFIVGGEYGSGVMSCRTGADWSAPVFMQLAKGSWGLQIGAEQIDLVLLVMNKSGMDKLLKDKVSLGGDASVAAGPIGRSAQAATDAQLSAEMLSYSRSQGVFAGIDISGGMLSPDKNALERAYGQHVTAQGVIAGTSRVTSPTEAKAFLQELRRGTSRQAASHR